MIKPSNGDTPFSLTYGTEAVIPAKIGMPTFRTTEIDMVQNDESLEINLDLLEERREQVAICEARSKAKMEKYYNSKVRNTSFRPGDLVYQNNDSSHAKDSGKLSLKWEGPYEVTEALGNGAYKFRDRNGKHLLRTWNVCNLKKLHMEYLAKISKKARILELKRRYLKITVLTTNTSYPSKKIRRICAYISLKTTKETRSNTPYLGKINTPYSSHMEINYSGRYQT
ncbi:hypothetical protein Tco_1514887 [Tanacetum coccineum]